MRITPLERYRGKQMVLSGAVRRFGRSTSLSGHVLRFAIADKDTMRRIVTVQTGSGITQDEQGHWTVSIPASTMSRNNFPDSEYWWELDILVDGVTNNARALERGPFTLLPSPFAT